MGSMLAKEQLSRFGTWNRCPCWKK